MAWTRVVTGRLKSDYQYSIHIVYNNFPWPLTTIKQQENIKKLSQNILDTRNLFPDSSLAELYDPLTMPPQLLKAHLNLDKAVLNLYGFSRLDKTEASWVVELMKLHNRLILSN
jgi:hypothetical protein